MRSILYIGMILAGAYLVTGCNPDVEPEGTDPLLPFSVRRVFSRGDFAYAAVIFKSEHDRADGNEGIVAVDARRLFIDGEPLSNERVQPPEDPGQNVWIHDIGKTEIWGMLDAGLVGLNAGAAKVELFDLTDPASPVATAEVTIPVTGDPGAGAGIRQFNVIDSEHVAVETFDATTPRIVIVRPDAAPGSQIISETEMPEGGCGTLLTRGSYAYCIHTIGSVPVENANVRVLEWSPVTGLGAVVQSLTVGNLYFSASSFFAADGSLHVLDRGLGNSNPGGIVVLDVDGASGEVSYAGKFAAPMVGSDRVIPVSGFSLDSATLALGTLSGAFLLDSAGTVTGSETSLNAASVVSGASLGSGYVLGGAGDGGMSLYRAAGGSLTRVRTYHRSWGDSFPNYGTIHESVY